MRIHVYYGLTHWYFYPPRRHKEKKEKSSSHKPQRSGDKKKRMRKVVYYETDSSSTSTSGSDAASVTSKRQERKKYSKIPLRYPRISKHTPLLSVPLGKPPTFDGEDYARWSDLMIQGRQARRPHPPDRKSTRLNSSHITRSRMPSSA